MGESATLAVTRRAKEMTQQGIDVVTFGVGQPDVTTPAHICQAAKKALDEGHTGYAIPASGLAIAKEAVCRRFRRANGLDYEPSQVMVTVGAKEALFLGFMAAVNDGDEVLIPAPYWVSYPEQVRVAGGKPVVLHPPEANSFRLTPAMLEEALTERTRVVVLNYPSNPGGFSYSRSQLEGLAEVLAGHDVVVVADEMYDRLVYGDQQHVSWAALNEETYAKTLTVNGASKTYSMTGWRIGFAAGPTSWIQAMAKLQSQMTSGAVHFAQYGLVAALDGDQGCVEQMRQEYDRRRRLMYEGLRALPGISCVEPSGAFFCFPDISEACRRLGLAGSVEFAAKLLEEGHVAVVPGAAFGCDHHVRLSYALSPERIREGLQRLQRFLGG